MLYKLKRQVLESIWGHIVVTHLLIFRIAQANKYQAFTDPNKDLLQLSLMFGVMLQKGEKHLMKAWNYQRNKIYALGLRLGSTLCANHR